MSYRFLPATLLFAVVALGLTLAGPALARSKDVLPGPIPADVVEVVDGDTLRVRAHIWLGQVVETRVRLTGIDAPEMQGSCEAERQAASRARTRLAQLAGSRRVMLEDIQPDKFGGRVLARVHGPNGDLGRDLIANGFARPYAGSNRGKWCERLAGTETSPPVARR